MRSTSLVHILRRRWQVVAPILLLTLTGVIYLEANAQHTFEASGSFLVASPDVGSSVSDPSLALPPLVDELMLSELVQDLEAEDVQLATSPSDDGSYELFAYTKSADASRDALIRAEEWATDRFETVQMEAGVAAGNRTQLRWGSDPAAWSLSDGREAAATTVEVDETTATPNPYSPGQALRLLQVVATSDASRARFAASTSEDTTFGFATDPRASPPIVSIRASGPGVEAGMTAFQTIVDLLEDELDSRQDRSGVAPASRHRLEPIALPIDAKRMDRVPSNLSILLVTIGFVGALGIGALVDLLLLRRSR